MDMREVYVDHAAAAPIDTRVAANMQEFLGAAGNPSSFHTKGKVLRDAIDAVRAQVASVIGARPDEVIFTSGGTESDNLAILGTARQYAEKGKHIISVKSEHEAVLEALNQLEKEGFEVTLLDPDAFGAVSADQVIAALRDNTILVSVMLANNEIGTINPIAEIGRALNSNKRENLFPLFHTDACQAIGSMEVNIDALHVDMLTLNAAKIYGPKGIGALYTHRGVKLKSLQYGGSQEKRIRPGTENLLGIIGLGEAIRLAEEEREAYVPRVTALRDKLIAGIQERIPKVRLNGHRENRLPNNVNISFMDIEGEALLLYLDAAGIYASTGSACTSASLDPSHVILSLGVPYEVAHGSIRFSLGRSTTEEDIDYILEQLPPLVEKLRKISPVNVDERHF